jgi:hypothetical protein
MSISRAWTWKKNSNPTEHDIDTLTPTLDALAAEWSAIQTEIEHEGFRRQRDIEDGDGPEQPECEHCDRGYIGFDRRKKFYCREGRHWGNPDEHLVFPKCPACGGTGIDQKEVARIEKIVRQREAEREVKLEIIEGLLTKYGARMMRPYEHWNEDEAYMAYQERDRY